MIIYFILFYFILFLMNIFILDKGIWQQLPARNREEGFNVTSFL